MNVNQVVEEARGLMSGQREDTMSFLAQAFVTKRLQNSEVMESAKAKALALLLEKLEDPEQAGQMRPGTLVALIETLGDQAGKDFKVVVEAQTTVAASKNQQASGGLSFFFGSATQDGAPAPAQVPRSMYKLLDVLNQAAEAAVVSSGSAGGAP